MHSNKIVIFSELTTEQKLVEIEKQSEQYKGLVVDMNRPDQRKQVKESAAVINDILKRLDRARIDKAKDYKERVEAEAKAIRERLEAANRPLTQLIDAHAEQQRIIREAEKARQDKIQAAFDKLNDSALEAIGQTSTVIEVIIEDIQAFDFDPDVFQECTNEAIDKQRDLLAKLDQMLKGAIAQEENEAKLAKLAAMEEAQRRAEQAEAQRQHDEEIAEQARAEAEKRHIEQLAQAEERAKQQAEQALFDARVAVERAAEEERKRIEREQDAQKQEEARREANKKHAAKIHSDILAALVAGGVGENAAKLVIKLAANKQAATMFIQY